MRSVSCRAVTVAVGFATLAAGPFAAASDASADEKAVLYIGWRAEAEFGGFFQALAAGIYKAHGLDVEIRLGRPQGNPAPLLIAGRVDFTLGSSGTALNAAREGAPIAAVAAFFQKDPRVMIGHPGQGYRTLKDMNDRKALIAAIGKVTFWPFLRQRYGFKDENIRPYTFSPAPFLADKTAVQQGYATSEPLTLRKAGVSEPVVFLLYDYGYQPYANNVMATREAISSRPAYVQKFVDASIQGWKDYLYGDPSPGNTMIKARNPDMSDDEIAFARKAIIDMGLVDSGDAKEYGIGCMTAERWNSYYKTMVDIGAMPAGVDVNKAYTLKFVNKSVGMK